MPETEKGCRQGLTRTLSDTHPLFDPLPRPPTAASQAPGPPADDDPITLIPDKAPFRRPAIILVDKQTPS